MVRFLADASLNHYIVAACLRREPAMDFLSARAANLEGAPDPWVLALAAEEGRVVVTHDVRTMPRHFGDFLAAGGHSPGPAHSDCDCRRVAAVDLGSFGPTRMGEPDPRDPV